jgi:hypothetical protein
MLYLVELQPAASIHILSKQQVDILTERAKGDSYRIIHDRNPLCHAESRVPCFVASPWVSIGPESELAGACHISQILIDGDFGSFQANAWDLSIVLQREDQLMSLSISVVSAFKLQLRFCKS